MPARFGDGKAMKAHLTGIGGTGMAALAGLLHETGCEVRGSDGVIYPPMSTLLHELQIPIYQGYTADNLDWGPDLMILGNTCASTHVEYIAAQQRGIDVVSFPWLLGQRFLQSRHSVVIAGTHGKTTTTSLVSQLLSAAGLDPGFFVGGIPQNFGRGFRQGSPPFFVVEGDEYDSACFDKRPKFVHYHARTVILTGVEYDHADIYPSLDEVSAAFAMLIDAVPADGRIFVAADSQLALDLCRKARCSVETYAASPPQGPGAGKTDAHPLFSGWSATYTPLDTGQIHRLHVRHDTTDHGSFDVPLCGAHNMSNALAAIAAAHSLGVDGHAIARGLAEFRGVARRQQVRGVINGITVVDDFAHHPTAIRETLRALRGVHGSGSLIAVFEPRSATSRRRVFQEQFAEALAEADQAIVAPLFMPEKIPPAERLDVAQLVNRLRQLHTDAHQLSVDDITTHLRRSCQPGDTVVVMSSGGFDGLVGRLFKALDAAGEDGALT